MSRCDRYLRYKAKLRSRGLTACGKPWKVRRIYTFAEAVANSRQRFLTKVSTCDGDGCWGWNASVDRGGYGNFTVTVGGAQQHVGAHRVAWLLFRESTIPEGMFVCHECDNRACVRPDHLFLGTRQDNVDDMVYKGRQSRGVSHATACAPGLQKARRRGEAHHNTPLTEADVRQMRANREAGDTLAALSCKFGVSISAVGRIVKRQTWSHVAETAVDTARAQAPYTPETP